MFSEYFQSEIPGRLVINSLFYKHAFVRSKEGHDSCVLWLNIESETFAVIPKFPYTLVTCT